mgnify:CR=1 FL=1
MAGVFRKPFGCGAWIFAPDDPAMPRTAVTVPETREALDAFQLCAQLEGIIPALEPAHALAYVTKLAPTLPQDNLLVMNMCGRGDKDIFTVAEALGTAI